MDENKNKTKKIKKTTYNPKYYYNKKDIIKKKRETYAYFEYEGKTFLFKRRDLPSIEKYKIDKMDKDSIIFIK